MRTQNWSWLSTFLAAAVISVAAPAAQAGEPLLVPDFTPGSTTEFGLAFLLQGKVIDGLRQQGHIVLDNAAASPIVGDSIMSCADLPGCPFAALQQLPARAAVVGRVARTTDGALTVYVAAYEQGDSRPVDSRDFIVAGGDEDEIVREVVTMVDEMLSLLGPAPADQLMAAVDLLEAVEDPPAARRVEPDLAPTGPLFGAPDPVVVAPPTPRYVPVVDPMPPQPRPDQSRTGVLSPSDYESAPMDVLLEGSTLSPRHVEGLGWHFRRSEISARQWNRRNMPHAGRVIVELRGGIGIGDVSRTADVRVNVAFDGQNASEWFQEGPTVGQGVRGALYVGYAPTAWIDIGAGFGLQYGQKGLTSGYVDDANNASSVGDDAVTALQFFIEPRVRVYPLPFGPVKPFIGVGAEVRMFDPYDIIEPEGVTYPDPPGGAYVGPQFSGGILFDAGPVVGVFGEASYTMHLGSRADAARMGEAPTDAPAPPESQGYTLNFVGGLQFRI
ncbi:MAG: hypothetical protein ACJATT_002931 [Myxococcota bacterium]|jgi:hypothetical protein